MTALYRIVTGRGVYRAATEVRPGDLDELARLAKRAAEAKADLERAILDAVHKAYSLRAIAEHADLSRMSVKRRARAGS